MNKELTIFSVYHRKFPVPECDYIQPIQVGRVFTNLELGFISDDIGENIANKNKTYSELTALFWIWKNIDKIESKWIGLCHYRRYFVLPKTRVIKKLFSSKLITDPRDSYNMEFNKSLLIDISSQQLKYKLIEALSAGKMVVPSQAYLSLELKAEANIKMHYIYNHISEDWYLMQAAVLSLYPEYENSFNIFFERETKMHCYNMFIANKVIFDAYCTWLFTILFELEKTVKLSEYEYQRRIFGFFSERLFNLYLFHNKLEKYEFPVLFFT
ncbi:uncharacterized protein DUF4422 [Pedobacter psychrotolerans]|uniref:Exopolysaccharide biosynthesis protein n=1 Tax=Pedobacter psychrotolerans TaxID=1843235 RepID=A0A4R2HA21_9SPHI|nr:DUF4422 domain-containing protein [Pedobacter psychrotolerans]TCO23888.1 uncharacterized protein DUF4422 [Pedobacter psychrotolerans]GGE63335.1 exopolysaccharide biosynthesis protein [Pedobacter psychrotolerans]